MAGLMDSIDLRTNLAGQNRLELLLFRLKGRQRFAINVFKVREVISCPRLRAMPNAHHVVRGVANMRGQTIPVLDLSLAIGRSAIQDSDKVKVIVTEFNRKVQGFLVQDVENIVNMNWEDIQPPPVSAGNANYLTAVTRINDELVEIIDVEKVLAETLGTHSVVSENVRSQAEALDESHATTRSRRILVVDDSSVARNQIKRTLEQLGMQCELANDGRQGLDLLRQRVTLGPITDYYDLVISDVEMPEMDGYTLTAEIRRDEKLRGLYVILHTSLSGVFNESIVKRVGADKFIPKFSADDLASTVLGHFHES